jgi:hypothetical protein
VEYKDSNGQEIKVGQTVLVPFRVSKLAGGQGGQLVHLESQEAYGHINPNVDGPLKGRTKNGLWAEPSQIAVEVPKP